MSRRPSSALLLAVAGVAAGCGGASKPPVAKPQEVALGWSQRCDADAPRLRIRAYFRRIVVKQHRWEVDAAVVNEGRRRVFLTRPLEYRGRLPGRTFVGLKPDSAPGARPTLIADRFTPKLPLVLAPGSRWSGTFSGRGDLPRGEPIRIVLGRFELYAPYGGYLCPSDRAVRLR